MDKEKMEKTGPGERVGKKRKGGAPQGSRVTNEQRVYKKPVEADPKREIEKFIMRKPPIGEKDDYDSENSWISDGLPSSSRRRRRGDGRWEGGEWREQ